MFEPTDEQRETLAEWFSTLHLNNRGHQFAIDFSLTLCEDKPATSLRRANLVLQGGPFVAVNQALDFVHGLGFSTKQLRDNGAWYCARSPSRFDLLLPEASDDDARVRQAGEFFGYPERDVQWIVSTPPDERVGPETRAENNEFAPEELAYVDLLPNLHEDSIEGYERAIETGKHLRKRLSDLADDWELPVIDEMVTEHYNAHRDVYSGKKDHFPGEEIGFKMVCKNPNLD